jgi:hypothetical protein
MTKFVLVLALCMLAAGSAFATGPPSAFSPAVGGHNYVPGGRDICWSEPADLADAKITSEIIAMFGLESELANDFVLGTDNTISAAIGYGGYYNWVAGDPPITSLNWKFYSDGGCYPDALMDTFTGLGSETFIGYDGYGYPTYRYEASVTFNTIANNLYWLGLQAADHPFPPQWGRQGAGVVTNCDTLFKSDYFGYPNWTPAGDLVGAPFDAAQEFDCSGIPPIAVEKTSWGAVKGLFR